MEDYNNSGFCTTNNNQANQHISSTTKDVPNASLLKVHSNQEGDSSESSSPSIIEITGVWQMLEHFSDVKMGEIRRMMTLSDEELREKYSVKLCFDRKTYNEIVEKHKGESNENELITNDLFDAGLI